MKAVDHQYVLSLSLSLVLYVNATHLEQIQPRSLRASVAQVHDNNLFSRVSRSLHQTKSGVHLCAGGQPIRISVLLTVSHVTQSSLGNIS